MNQFAITVMSRDRVGIVRDIARQIATLHGNIKDLSQTVVSGYFTMILVSEFASPTTANDLRLSLLEVNQQRQAGTPPLEIAVMAISEQAIAQRVAPQDVYVLTASGEDRIGFVADVASFCAENAINILDLATLVNDGQYMMILQVDLSRCTSLKAIHRKLQQFVQSSGIRMVLQHNDIFEATHGINMPN
ncbi:MAG: ACT domain-containing protein [Caldilineaceae bacterium]